MFDSIPVPATLIDARGIVVDINQAFLDQARAYGRPIRREDRIGEHITSFGGPEEERARFRTFIDGLLHTGKVQHLLWSGEDEAGRQRFGNIHAAPFKDAAGRVTGALILREDITARKRQEVRQQAVQRVRDAIWKMKTSEDIEQVVMAVHESLRSLEIPFTRC